MASADTWKKRWLRILPGLLILALAGHFLLVGLYVTPVTPYKLRINRTVNAYIQPLFDQKWELFAPEPNVDTRMILVSCRLQDAKGEVEQTPWSNMTAAFRELKYKYRLSPADRLERAQHSALHMLFSEQDPLVKKLLANPDEDSPKYQQALKLIEDERKRKIELGVRLLNRTASSECDRLYGLGRTQEARVRLVVVKSPPYSQRALPMEAGETTYSDFPWAAYERAASL